jgi:hypothetical protein
MKMKSSKALTMVLTVVFLFAVTASAFAAWPSFQSDLDNNGVLTGTPLTTQAGTGVTLTNNTQYLLVTPFNKAGSSFLGTVNNTAVINGGYAYYLYNGGSGAGSYSGARIAKYDLSTNAEVWNEQASSAVFAQLSTPVLVGDSLYFLSTGAAPVFTNAPATLNIAKSSSATVMNEVKLAGTSSARLYVEAAIDAASASTNIDLSIQVTKPDNAVVDLNMDNDDPTETGAPTTKPLSTTSSSLNKNFSTVFSTAGDYTIVCKYTNNDLVKDGIVNVSDCQLFENSFQLKKVNDVTAADPTISNVFSAAVSGQANTPIEYDGKYLYFGTWTGSGGSYYQVDISGSSVVTKQYSPGAGFYWAGATVVDGKVYFGCDDGNLYWRSVSAFDTTGGVIPASGSAGQIRSSIMHYDTGTQDVLYFTSRNGYVWRYVIDTATLTNQQITTTSVNSTSTPVVSDNGVLYVGYYSGFTNGGVRAIAPDLSGSWYDVYTDGPVQCSPIVYSDVVDYVYFTTNASAAKGYCYSYVPVSHAATWIWDTPNANYALGGMSGDGRYLTFGDNGGSLFVIKKP